MNCKESSIMAGLEGIKCELSLLSAEVKKVMEENDLCAKPEEWILQLQDLAYDIEDFIVKLGRGPKPSAPVRVLQAPTLKDPSSNYLACINHFKELIEKIRACKENPVMSIATTPTRSIQQRPSYTPAAGTSAAASSSAPTRSRVHQLVGMEQLNELVDLLVEAGGHQLKVISIVGCGGLGKTTLAQALHDDDRIKKRFGCHRAMVEAPSSLDNLNNTLHEILQQCNYQDLMLSGRIRRVIPQLRRHSNDPGNYEQLITDLQTFLRNKRYFVIIDGVQQREVWDGIHAALPSNEEGSRVVITTSIRSVATGCSSRSYLYPMRGLDKAESADLFWAKLGEKRIPALELDLATFFGKWDGLPLALVGTADYLRNKGGHLKGETCKDVGNALGSLLAGKEPSFGQMKRTLAQCCGRVEQGQKMCMLSVCSFPKGHQINRKSLIRRLMAEGLVSANFQLGEERVASNCLDDLLDLGIVDPVPCGGNSTVGTSKVKRCQVHGVMLEFLVHQSASWNFITLINGGTVVRNHDTTCAARRLLIHGVASNIDRSTADTIKLSSIRSLTICNTSNLMSSLRSCELLWVLDLEDCSWLCNKDLRDICRLLYLKYLSLRRTPISEIPITIKDLHCLETLDVRQTLVDKLPMEVIKLPMITHLFGKFELPVELGETKRADELKKFFSEKSKLQTLSGFKIINNNQGFELILQHASKLRKVKIWCEVPTTSSSISRPSRGSSFARQITDGFKKKKTNKVSNVDSLPDSLVSTLEKRFTGSDALESLSVDFGDLCLNFLDIVLKDPCAVNSIKVWGQMLTLPPSPMLKNLRYIKELHLCNTGLQSEDLSGLQSIDCLVYLKLVEICKDYWEGTFIVKTDGFRSLKQLCLHGPKLPTLEFEQDAERERPLVSLQLICLEPADQLGVTGIVHLPHLSEVILHPDSPQGKIEAWKREALNHKNRPYIKRQRGSCDKA